MEHLKGCSDGEKNEMGEYFKIKIKSGTLLLVLLFLNVILIVING